MCDENGSKETYFLSFCIEQYKNAKNIDGQVAKKIFDESGVTNFLLENYEVLHTQGRDWILEEIDDFLKNNGESK